MRPRESSASAIGPPGLASQGRRWPSPPGPSPRAGRTPVWCCVAGRASGMRRPPAGRASTVGPTCNGSAPVLSRSGGALEGAPCSQAITESNKASGPAAQTPNPWVRVIDSSAPASSKARSMRGSPYLAAMTSRCVGIRRSHPGGAATHPDGAPVRYTGPELGPRMSARRDVGRYTICEEIASGGMAKVYLGKLRGPIGFARTVAIKGLHPGLTEDPQFVAMLLDEAHLASKVRHPNVVPIIDMVWTDDAFFLVLEYVHGMSLSRLL